MGQYHTIYNTTKKEYITAHGHGTGTKLLEMTSSYLYMTSFCSLLSNSNGRGGGDLHIPENAKHKKYIEDIVGRWAGDSIVVQGDYAEEGDPAYIPDKEIEKYKCIDKECLRSTLTDNYMREKELKDNSYLTEKNVTQIAREIEEEIKNG